MEINSIDLFTAEIGGRNSWVKKVFLFFFVNDTNKGSVLFRSKASRCWFCVSWLTGKHLPQQMDLQPDKFSELHLRLKDVFCRYGHHEKVLSNRHKQTFQNPLLDEGNDATWPLESFHVFFFFYNIESAFFKPQIIQKVKSNKTNKAVEKIPKRLAITMCQKVITGRLGETIWQRLEGLEFSHFNWWAWWVTGADQLVPGEGQAASISAHTCTASSRIPDALLFHCSVPPHPPPTVL